MSPKLVTRSAAKTGIRLRVSSKDSAIRFILPRDTNLYNPGLPAIESIVSISNNLYVLIVLIYHLFVYSRRTLHRSQSRNQNALIFLPASSGY